MPSFNIRKHLKQITTMQKANVSGAESSKRAETQVFNFQTEGSPVRVQVIEGEAWFVGKDVCAVLGISQHRKLISDLDEDERGLLLVHTLGGMQRMTAVSESGLYQLIFQSRKAEAKKFRKWVTSEVLPSIRKNGYYIAGQGGEKVIDARDVPYGSVELLGKEVKTVEVCGEAWYCLADVSRAVGNKKTCKTKSLNDKRPLARKVLTFGSSAAAWYVGELGVRLLVSSRKRKVSGQLLLDFKEGGIC